MMVDLGEGRHVAIHAHSAKVWLSSYNGCGVVNPLTKEEAIELKNALADAILELEK